MPRIGIALGTNLGDRLQNLQNARERLASIATAGEPLLSAPIYQTAPVNCPAGSPNFLNTVVEISWEGSPLALLTLTQAIEQELGRTTAPERNAPRVIDIDLLYFGSEILDAEPLILPHPRITQRRFVLQPLAYICPHLILPGHQNSIAQNLGRLSSTEPPLTLVHQVW